MITLICGLGNKFKFLGVDDYGVELLLVQRRRFWGNAKLAGIVLLRVTRPS